MRIPDDNRVTNYQYNPQDELLYAIQPADAQGKVTYAMYMYNNLGDVTETQTYLRPRVRRRSPPATIPIRC